MQKRKSLKDIFEENYAAVEVPAGNRRGYKVQYLYSGPWYIWDMPRDRLTKEKWMELGLSLAGLVLHLAVGAQEAAVNISRFGAVLAIMALCIHVLEISACIRFVCAGCRTTRMTYQDIDRILGAATGLRGIFLCGMTVAALCYGVMEGMNRISLLAILGYMGCAAIAFVIYRRYNRIAFYTEKNHSLEGKAVIRKRKAAL